MTAATVAVREQVLFKSDKGTVQLGSGNRAPGGPGGHQDAFIFMAGGFGYDNYWSSSENDNNNAWNQNFNNGDQNNNNKDNNLRVRPVRVFKQDPST